MDSRGRKDWVERELYSKPLYGQLLAEPFKTNPAFGVLRFAISRKWTWLSLLVGELVYRIRGV
jgi:hypothetical protein